MDSFNCKRSHYSRNNIKIYIITNVTVKYDIFVCGVLPEHQHNGIGKALYNVVENYFIQIGCKYVIVKTLSDVVNFKPYVQTREFYKSIGFESLITLTEMWDEENPCLIMLKRLI